MRRATGVARVPDGKRRKPFARAQGEKELHWIHGATHVGLYDKPEYVTSAVAKLTAFYQRHLAA